MQTFSGRQVWPLSPQASDIHIEDVAHHLSMICRFNGATKSFYSVAEHCVLLAVTTPEEEPIETRLWALLHDGPEAYIHDLTRPFKKSLPTYNVLERAWEIAFAERFDLPHDIPLIVRAFDNRLLFDERNALLAPPFLAWDYELEPLGVEPFGFTPEQAERAFLTVFRLLDGERKRAEGSRGGVVAAPLQPC
jgi:hypothetical protein